MIVEPASSHFVWMDGSFVPWRDVTLGIFDHHYGVGVFEGVRAYSTENGASVFRLADHTARLFRSAHILEIPMPSHCDQATLNSAQLEVLRRNQLSDAYLRPFVFYSGLMGIRPSTKDLTVRVAVVALEWRGEVKGSRALGGIRLRTANSARPSPSGLSTKAKANANYMHGIIALQEAQKAGADDVLLIDEREYVTETSGANLFLARDGVLYTPPAASVLEGITRDTIFVLAAELGFKVVERQLTRDDVYVADEALLTGTATEVAPVVELDGRTIGRGEPGPMTAQLREIYRALVRKQGDGHPEWFSEV